MSIESLKQQARKHEQDEEWQKALAQYMKVLAALTHEEQVDIGLYNRVGDLHLRVGGLDQAVEHYDKAVDLYREAYLPNNAIAVCKKIIRSMPERHRAYLMIGQIRAEQGFLPDARTHFLTYAERMAGDGNLDESFRALVEFCELAPDDVGMRITVADQMIAQGMEDQALQQLTFAHRHYVQLGDDQQAADLKGRILAIDPNADVDAIAAGLPTSSFGSDGAITSDFGDLSFDSAPDSAVEEAAGDGEADVRGRDFAIASGDEDEEFELPMMDFGSSDEDTDQGEVIELAPMDGFLELDDVGQIHDTDVTVGDSGSTFSMIEPEALADVTEPMAEPASEGPVVASPVPEAPVSADDDGDGFVDFGAMILGGDSEKSTRFTVAYEEPSGDEQADFAEMLAQFKDKVSENLDSSDVRAHSDLGTAYKEMGLLDEAIASFQAALRASADHLPTYELMGQTFMEMGKPEATVKSLERAMEVATTVEDELVGIYYYLGRAHAELGNRESAVDFYDRVFSLDINFADVSERLRELR